VFLLARKKKVNICTILYKFVRTAVQMNPGAGVAHLSSYVGRE
jgi:hypothetical protein